MSSRDERAVRLRPPVREAVRRSSLRDVAVEIGVSHTSLHNFLEKGFVPYERTLDKIEAWADNAGVAVEAEPSLDGEVAPNYESLGIDLPGYARLHDKPRRMFDHFMVEMIARGLGREDLEELGRGMLSPIAHFNTLHKGREESDARSEEDQIMVISAMIKLARKMVQEGDGLR